MLLKLWRSRFSSGSLSASTRLFFPLLSLEMVGASVIVPALNANNDYPFFSLVLDGLLRKA